MLRLMKQNSDYLSLKAQRIEAPQWFTPNKVAWTDGKTELLEFRKGHKPVVIVAPEACHSSHIGDYAYKQSLVQCAMNNQQGGVYLINKLGAKQEHKDLGIEYCFSSLKEATDPIDDEMNLVGLCQGGWQSAVFAARYIERIKSLTLAAAPIDCHIVPSSISAFIDAFPQSEYEAIVRNGNGLMRGKDMLKGFTAGKILTWPSDEIKLWTNADNAVFRERNRIFNNWYYTTQDIPGRQYLEIVQQLFRNNQLEQYADLSKITCPVNLIAGSKDPITPAPQLFAMSKMCPQAKEYTVKAGHIGVFMAEKVVRGIWTDLFRGMVAQQIPFAYLGN